MGSEMCIRDRRGRYQFGQYSDDSQLARELIVSCLHCAQFDPNDYAKRIALIFSEDRIVGRGLATDLAAKRLARGVPWELAAEPPPSAGNGTAMRAGPVGLFFWDRPERLAQAAHDQGRITHQDRRCSAGSIAIAGAVTLALRSGPLQTPDFVAQLAEWTEPYDSIMASALRKMPEWLIASAHTAALEISRVGVPPDFKDGWELISPFVTTSVLWSIYSFLQNPDDYMEAICTSIAVGGDVDTTAAMTGAISGARLGLDRIPHRLARRVNDNGTWGYDELVRLAQECHRVVMQGQFG